MSMNWNVFRLIRDESLSPQTAELLEELLECSDEGSALRISDDIEYRVAPVTGGLSADAASVVRVLRDGLVIMTSPARVAAVALMSRIAGSALLLDARLTRDVVAQLVRCLEPVANLAQLDIDHVRSEFIDLLALCADLDPWAGGYVRDLLSWVVRDVGGIIGESAQRELALLASGG